MPSSMGLGYDSLGAFDAQDSWKGIGVSRGEKEVMELGVVGKMSLLVKQNGTSQLETTIVIYICQFIVAPCFQTLLLSIKCCIFRFAISVSVLFLTVQSVSLGDVSQLL